MNQKRSVNPIIAVIIMLAMILLIVSGIIVFIPFSGTGSLAVQTEQGVSYLKELEDRDVSALDEQVRERIDPAETEGMTVWEKLDYYDTYIFGDSRGEVLYWSGMQMEHVFVEKNATIKYIGELIDIVADTKPRNLLLTFGINDLGMYAFDPDNYWETGEDYAQAYDYYIGLIHEVSPDTVVYINSIIPVQPYAVDIQPRWALIPEFNEALQKYCDSHDAVYVDANDIAEEYGDLFNDDGVHFYAQAAIDAWGETILAAVEGQMLR